MSSKTFYKSEKGKMIIAQHYETYINSFGLKVERNYIDTSFGKTHVLVAGPKDGKPIFVFQGGN